MQNSIKPTVLVIIVLSLLLGLSIGQHYRQYRKIQALENGIADFQPMQIHINTNRCQANFRFIQAEMDANRAEIEARRAEIEAIKAKMLAEREAQLKELHQQIEQVRKMWKQGRK